MEPILIFAVFYTLGFLAVLISWGIYNIKKENDRQIKKEQFEDEIISSLLELKEYTTTNLEDGKLSNKYDLIGIALENDVTNIIIVNDEGLPVLSTLENSDEYSAKYSALFQRVSKLSKNKPSKVSIKYDDGYYINILPMVKDNNKLYVIIKSNIEIDTMTEKKLLFEVSNVLDEYFPSNT